MRLRFRRLNIVITLAVAASIALVGIAPRVHAAGASKHPVAAKGSTGPACKKSAHVKAKGTVKFSDWQFPDNLNTYQWGNLTVDAENRAGMAESYFTYDSKSHFTPVMLTAIPTIKNGGITQGGKLVTIHLKKGLQWSDGKEITSADIKFGWKVDSDKVTGPACLGSCDIISRIDTPDKYTATFHLKSVAATFLQYDLPSFWPSKWPGAWSNNAHDAAVKLAQDTSYTFEGPNYPTNGPYQLATFIKDDRIVYHPMKYYGNLQCGASALNLIFVFYSSKPGMIAAAANHDTDVTQNYTPADLPDLRKNTSSYKLYAIPAYVFEHLELNHAATYQGKPNPLADPNVRVALALALDKVGLIESAMGTSAKEARTIIAWTPLVNTPSLTQPFADKALTGQWDPIAKKYQASPGTGQALTDAKKILDKTQYASGFTLDFHTTSGNPVRAAQESVIAASWLKIGVKLNANFIPASKFFGGWDSGGVLTHGDFQVGMFAFGGSPDPDQLKYNMQSQYIEVNKPTHPCATCQNYSQIQDNVINKAFDKAFKTLDKTVRQNYYNQVQVQTNKLAHWIPLFFRPDISTQNSHFSNYSPNPTQVTDEWNDYKWTTKS